MDFANAVYVATITGVGIIPETGKGTLSAWAKLFCVEVQTVRGWFEDSDLPYERWGKERVYHAEDVNAARPKITKATDPDYGKHGGKRRKGTTR